MRIDRFQNTVLSWYQKHRRNLPWRRTRDPYKILVSEIMLQQTQIARVLPKYREFLRAFPSLQALARTPNRKLFKVWAGLGYWRRALFLKETAKKILKEHQRKFPHKPEDLEKLPGIGPYTARALACFAFGNKEPFLDTNMRRVYLHFFFPRKRNVPDGKILEIAQKAVWTKNPREWHYALFDYGAAVLKDKRINRRSRRYRRQTPFEGSFRSFRTKVVRFLLAQKQNRAPHKTVEALLEESLYPPRAVISALLKDRLIKKSASYYYL